MSLVVPVLFYISYPLLVACRQCSLLFGVILCFLWLVVVPHMLNLLFNVSFEGSPKGFLVYP